MQTWMQHSSLLLLLLAAGATASIPAATISYSNGELTFMFDAPQGAALLGLHYSVNRRLIGVAAGQYNHDLTPSGGQFRHSRHINLHYGDFVSYWYIVLVNGAGHKLTDQVWVLEGAPTRPPITPPPTAPPTTPPPDESGCTTYPCKIFEDNFDFFDFKKWEHEITAGGGGNWEFQYYHNSRKNSFVRDGKLFIKPTLTEDDHDENFVRNGNLELWGASPANLCTGNQWYGCQRQGGGNVIVNPVQSARLRTAKSFNYRYGKLEIEAKLPAGDWLWPAMWLLPQYNEYGDWPRSGEIDLMEARGNRNLTEASGKSGGIDQIGMTMHWGPKSEYNAWSKTHETVNLPPGESFADKFHRFQVEWGPDVGIKFMLDDRHIYTVNPPNGFWDFGRDIFVDPQTNKPLNESVESPWRRDIVPDATRLAPFDKPFFIVLNVAVGGTNAYFNDNLVNSPYPKPWINTSPNAALDFYNAKHQWYPTWQREGDTNAMQINYVRVWKMKPDQ